MKLTNPIEFIQLGGRIRYLSNCDVSQIIFGEGYIYDNLLILKNDLVDLGFVVSQNLYKSTIAPIEEEFEKQKLEFENGNDKGKLSLDQKTKLKKAILSFEKTVLAEAKTRIIASPIPRRFDLNHLLEEPEKILGNDVYENLTDLAQSDLNSACKCLAFESPTAASFHILRAIEECVRVLYKSYFPRKDEKRPWGHLTNELRNKPRNPKVDEILMNHLDHLRKRFRNPTDHPEKIYEIEEAEDLIHISVDVINRCIRDTQVVKKNKN